MGKYELLNEVEMDLSEYNIEEVDDLAKKRMMNKFKSSQKKRKKTKKRIVAATLAAVLVSGVFFTESRSIMVLAANLFTNSVSNWLRVDKDYSTKLDKTLKMGDTKIKVNEFFSEKNRVVINMDINKTVNDVFGEPEKYIPRIYINDTLYEVPDTCDPFYSMAEKNEEMNLTLEFWIENLNINDGETLKLEFNRVSDNAKKNSLTFEYDRSLYNNDTKEIEVNKEININNEASIKIDKLIVRPDRTEVIGDSKNFYHLSDVCNNEKYYYYVLDQDNNELYLQFDMGDYCYFYNWYSYEDDYDKIMEKRVTKLTIIPFTLEKIDPNSVEAEYDGRTVFELKDKAITINLQ